MGAVETLSYVVCRDSAGEIISAELLDIYEGKILHDLEFEHLSGTLKQNYDRIIKQSFPNYSSLPGNRVNSFLTVEEIFLGFKMLPAGVALKPIDDSGHVFIPGNCKVEQVANYYNARAIYIVSDIYNKFSELDKLGLILHEAIYLMDRATGVSNSRYTRRVVAHLLSKGFIADPVESEYEEGLIICTGASNDEDGSANAKTTSLTMRPSKRFPELMEMEFDVIAGYKVYSRKRALVNMPDGFPETRSGVDGTTVMQTESKIDGMEPVIATFDSNYQRGEFELQWQGFDPGDRIIVMLSCFSWREN